MGDYNGGAGWWDPGLAADGGAGSKGIVLSSLSKRNYRIRLFSQYINDYLKT